MPQIVAVTNAIKKSEVLGENYGIDGIPRHLRRRTKSHNPYKHRRRPNVLKEGLAAAAAEQKEGGGGGGTENNDDDDAAPGVHPPFTNRKMRRRPGKINEAALESARWTESSIIDEQQHRRPCLETHVWHAKRLSMQSTFNGWVLPEGEPGRGRGSRSFLRRLEKSSTAAILHDASYWCPLSMTGPSLQAIFNCLKQSVDPRTAADLAHKLENDDKGNWEVDTMLHRPNTFPLGALSPSFIDVFRDTEMVVIWVHGAAVAETYVALQAAIKLEEEVTTTTTDGVAITLKMLDLRRIEVRGQGSDAALAKALFFNNSTSSVEEKEKEERTSSVSSSSSLPLSLQRLQPGEAVLISVADPRMAKPITLGCSSISLLHHHHLVHENEETKKNLLFTDSEHPLPLSEAAISHARYVARQQLVLGETDGASAPSSWLSVLEGRSHCATLCIRQKSSSSNGFCAGNGGWSIIVPPGWVMPLWLSLIFQGCRATGQREWRWYHTLEHRPFFPIDAVDTPAYSVAMHTLQQQREEVEEKKPKGKKTPLHRQQLLPPPWDSLVVVSERSSSSGGAKDIVFVVRSESEMLKAVFGSVGDAHDEQSGSKEKTSSSSTRRRKRSFVAEALAAGRLQWQPKQQEQQQSNACLVQVLVQCIKRGAAENGAAVCVIAGREDESNQQHPCYLRENESPDDAQSPCIDPSSLITIGYVTSAAPAGTGRERPSVAVCAASAFWRLRSLQFSESSSSSKCDEGTVNGWMLNPGSSALFPVRLSLLVEK